VSLLKPHTAIAVALAFLLGLCVGPRVSPAPGHLENFRGYEVYLDRHIQLSEVKGTSMGPTLREGDIVLWVEASPSELRVGDIIVYSHPTHPSAELVAHRIVEVENLGGSLRFRTKGDNVPEPDKYWVDEGHLKGLVIGVLFKD
jgi:signal peptidase I